MVNLPRARLRAARNHCHWAPSTVWSTPVSTAIRAKRSAWISKKGPRCVPTWKSYSRRNPRDDRDLTAEVGGPQLGVIRGTKALEHFQNAAPDGEHADQQEG